MWWSVQPLLVGDVLKDCHIILESLRNSAPLLFSTLPNHLASRCVARSQPRMSETECRQLWSVLGMSATMLDVVVEVDPWYDATLLHVNPLVFEDAAEDPFRKCSECVMYLLEWRRFTEARFLSMGLASSGLLTSLAVSLTAMVADALALPGVSTNLNGFSRLKEQQQVLMLILIVVHQLLNEWFALIMSDDRLLRARQDVLQTEEDELQLIRSWRPQIWSALASLIKVPYDSAVLRSQALHAVHLAAAYAHEKIFMVMEQYPWRLGLSTETDSLEELLLQSEEPLDLWRMLKAGVPPAELISVAEFLQQASWSSLAVEQAHGSSATVRRYHLQLTLDHHLNRSFLHQARLLFTPTYTQLQEEALRKKLDRLGGRRREVSARNVCFGNLVAEATRQVGGGPPTDSSSPGLAQAGGLSNVSSHYTNSCAALHQKMCMCKFDQSSVIQRLREQACASPLPGPQSLRCSALLRTWPTPVKRRRADSWAAVADSCPPFQFQVCLGEYCSRTDLPFEEDQVIFPVSNSYIQEGLDVVSFAKILSLETLLLSYEHRHRHSEHAEGYGCRPGCTPMVADVPEASCSF